MSRRMFAAVLPPPDVICQLDALVEPRRDADRSIRWTRPEGWHLTTAFMAAVEPSSLEALEGALADVAIRTPAFDLGLGGALAFPHPAKARVLALGVTAGSDRLTQLSTRCRTAASRCGTAPDNTRFTGHLTLARHNRGFQATKWLTVLDSFPPWSWRVSELCLVTSLLGARYEVAARFPLG